MMTGVGIGRFAKRNTNKISEASNSKQTAGPPAVPDSIALETDTAASDPPRQEHDWEDTSDGFAVSDSGGGDDFCFADDDDGTFFGDDQGTTGSNNLFLDDDVSFDKNSFSNGSDFGDDDVNVGNKLHPRNEATTVAAGGAGTGDDKPKGDFGFSRFAIKPKAPAATTTTTTEANPNGTRDETKTTSHHNPVTPNHRKEANSATMDVTGGKIQRQEHNDNNNSIGTTNNTTNNNGITPTANNKPPPQQAPSPYLPTTVNPPSLAVDPGVASNVRQNSRRVSFEDSSKIPSRQPVAAEATRGPRDTIPIAFQQQRKNTKTRTHGGAPNFHHGTSLSLHQHDSRGDAANSQRLLHGAAIKANGTLVSSFGQQHPSKNLAQDFRNEKFANVTDNRKMRKLTSAANAVTPNSSANGRSGATPSTRPIPRRSALRTGGSNPRMTPAAPTLQATPALPAPFGRTNAVAAPGEADCFDSQPAKFLATVRETEDLQEKIEIDLLGMNEQFSEHYALALRDLEEAVELLDKLEGMERLADDTLAGFKQQQQEHLSSDALAPEELVGNSESGSGAPQFNP